MYPELKGGIPTAVRRLAVAPEAGACARCNDVIVDALVVAGLSPEINVNFCLVFEHIRMQRSAGFPVNKHAHIPFWRACA